MKDPVVTMDLAAIGTRCMHGTEESTFLMVFTKSLIATAP